MPNLCAELQIDLARLWIFIHRADPAALDTSVAEAAASAYHNACARLHSVGIEKWVYPELLRNMADALIKFPISEVLGRSGHSSIDAQLIAASISRRTVSLRDFAEQFEAKRATSTLLAVARYIRSAVGVGARKDESIYDEVAQLAVEAKVQQLNSWAEATHNLLDVSGSGLLYEMVKHCPGLEPARPILTDLLERMERLVYVPFVFDEGRLGVCAPVEIEADFDQTAKEPRFCILGEESSEKPSWLQVKPGFVEAVKRGRSRACQMLAGRGCSPRWPKFGVTMRLPDLRIGEGELIYEQGSIELPVAIALFCQYPLLESSIALNPEVVSTGPIEPESLGPKVRAQRSVGGAVSLL